MKRHEYSPLMDENGQPRVFQNRTEYKAFLKEEAQKFRQALGARKNRQMRAYDKLRLEQKEKIRQAGGYWRSLENKATKPMVVVSLVGGLAGGAVGGGFGALLGLNGAAIVFGTAVLAYGAVKRTAQEISYLYGKKLGLSKAQVEAEIGKGYLDSRNKHHKGYQKQVQTWGGQMYATIQANRTARREGMKSKPRALTM